MKRFAALAAVMIMIGNAVLAEGFVINDLMTGKRATVATEKSSGKKLWANSMEVRKISYQGKPFIYTEDKGQGILGKEGKHQSWIVRSFFRIDGKQLVPFQVKAEYKDKEGNVIRTLQKDYDDKAGRIICTENGRAKQYRYISGMVDKENLGLSMANFPLEKKEFVFHLMTHEPTVYKMTGKNLGQEKLTVKGKEVLCNKIEMVPDLGMINMLGAFVPKTYFWMEAGTSHNFVRYEGLESGLGTPYIVIEDK